MAKAKTKKTTATVPATPPPAAPAPPAPTAGTSGRRRFEFVEGTSNKFWEVWVEGNVVNTQWGKIGTEGRNTLVPFADAAAAQAGMAKLIGEKTKKGYQEKTVAAAPAPAVPAAAAPAPPAPAAPAPAAAAAPPAAPAAAPKRRRFEFSEGTSNKFWEVWVEGSVLNTQWGKIGTEGRNTVKSFPDAAKAQAAAEKLIKEKTGEGYKEKTAAPAASAPAAPAPAAPPAPAPPAPAPAPTAAAPAAAPPAPRRRRFEFVEGTSNKFWEVWVEGNDVNTLWGRIGSEGRNTITSFPDAAAAQAGMAKLIGEKTKKGYKEKTSQG
jgi:predicted DNA-binding WGR domain protein